MTPRIAVCRLSLLLLLPGCHTWRPVALAPSTDFGRYSQVRVERRDQSTNSAAVAAGESAGTSYSRVALHGAWVKGDTLFGWQPGRSTPHAVAVADVRRAEARHVSGPRTTLLVAGVTLGAFALLIAAAVAAGPGMSY